MYLKNMAPCGCCHSWACDAAGTETLPVYLLSFIIFDLLTCELQKLISTYIILMLSCMYFQRRGSPWLLGCDSQSLEVAGLNTGCSTVGNFHQVMSRTVCSICFTIYLVVLSQSSIVIFRKEQHIVSLLGVPYILSLSRLSNPESLNFIRLLLRTISLSTML